MLVLTGCKWKMENGKMLVYISEIGARQGQEMKSWEKQRARKRKRKKSAGTPSQL